MALILWLCALTWAGPLEVVVREREDGDPIAGASVSTGEQVVPTDARGRAVLDLPEGEHTLAVHADAYLPATVEVHIPAETERRDPVRVWLDANPSAWEVVIEGFRPIPHPTRHAVDAEQAFETPGGYEDAFRLVQSLPAVAVQREYGPSAGDLWVRGSAPRDSRVFLDGIEVPYLYHYNQYASVFPASQLESLELYPSTFGAAYGDAVGAVVEARSAEQIPESVHGSATASFVMVGGDVRAPIRGGWVSAAARRSFFDLAGERSEQYPRWPRFHDFSARAELGDEDRSTGLFLWGSGDAYTRKAGELDVLDPWEAQTSPTLDYRRGFQIGGVRHVWDGDTRGRLILAGLRSHNSAALSAGGSETLDDFTATSRLDVSGRMGRIDWDAGWELRGSRTVLEVQPGGPDALLVSEEGPALARGIPLDDTLHRARLAGYAQVGIPAGDFRFMPGFRIGTDSAGAPVLPEPRLAVRWRPADGTALDLGGGYYLQRPESALLLASSDLPTTRSWQITAGIEQMFSGRLEVGLDFWHRQVRDPLVVPIDSRPYAARSGEGTGVELVTRYRLRERFFLWGWLALSRSTVTDGERTFPSDGDQPISGGLVASVDAGGWNFGLRYRYGSGLPWTPVRASLYDAGTDRWLPVPGEENAARYPAYQKVDVRVAHTWQLRGWDLTASMEIWFVPPSSAQLYPVWSYDYREQGWVVGPTVLPLGSVRATF